MKNIINRLEEEKAQLIKDKEIQNNNMNLIIIEKENLEEENNNLLIEKQASEKEYAQKLKEKEEKINLLSKN